MNKQIVFGIIVSFLALVYFARQEHSAPKSRAPDRVLPTRESGQPESRAIRIPLKALPAAVIAAPMPYQVIDTDVYDGMAGVLGPMPCGSQLWVFARNRYGMYLQYPPPSLNCQGEFRQSNVRLATVGSDWELVLCLATPEASRYLHLCARRREWSFPGLPDGVEPLKSVPVERK